MDDLIMRSGNLDSHHKEGNPTNNLEERERLKRTKYREAAEREAMGGIGGKCVLCVVGIPGGTYLAADRHEIVGKGRLPGKGNWEQLFTLENIAPACRLHHTQLQHFPLVWMKAMAQTGLARAEEYRRRPFNDYWEDALYPPVAECLGHFGFGNRFFQSSPLPESLARLYALSNPEFDARQFCEFCPQHMRCIILTSGRAQ